MFAFQLGARQLKLIQCLLGLVQLRAKAAADSLRRGKKQTGQRQKTRETLGRWVETPADLLLQVADLTLCFCELCAAVSLQKCQTDHLLCPKVHTALAAH